MGAVNATRRAALESTMLKDYKRRYGTSLDSTRREHSGMDKDKEGMIERRAARRHADRREAHVLFIASLVATEERRPSHTLIGYTRDVSESGLSLIVTSPLESDFERCDVDCVLRIKLSLPQGIAEMDCKVVRRDWIEKANPSKGYFVGVNIAEIGADDRERFAEYLAMVG